MTPKDNELLSVAQQLEKLARFARGTISAHAACEIMKYIDHLYRNIPAIVEIEANAQVEENGNMLVDDPQAANMEEEEAEEQAVQTHPTIADREEAYKSTILMIYRNCRTVAYLRLTQVIAQCCSAKHYLDSQNDQWLADTTFKNGFSLYFNTKPKDYEPLVRDRLLSELSIVSDFLAPELRALIDWQEIYTYIEAQQDIPRSQDRELLKLAIETCLTPLEAGKPGSLETLGRRALQGDRFAYALIVELSNVQNEALAEAAKEFVVKGATNFVSTNFDKSQLFHIVEVK